MTSSYAQLRKDAPSIKRAVRAYVQASHHPATLMGLPPPPRLMSKLAQETHRLIAMHANLIKPGAAMWRKAEAERRFKQRHAFTLEADQRYVANLCLDTACALKNVTRSAVLGERRIQFMADARHVAMAVAYELSSLSTIKLGQLFKRTRHMILHAQRRVNSDRALRAQADKVVAAVKKELRKR